MIFSCFLGWRFCFVLGTGEFVAWGHYALMDDSRKMEYAKESIERKRPYVRELSSSAFTLM
jgi:hypothetical protein